MSVILAALDSSSAARAVLETAVRIGQLTGADVKAVHIHAGLPESDETPVALAERSGVPVEVLEDPVESSLIAAMAAPGVIAAVIGARATPSGRRPVGLTARSILEQADKPVVVVAPEAVSPGAIRRLLVPLEGTEMSSQPVLERLMPLLVADVELVVLHVFTDATMPVMLDRPEYDMKILGDEFLTRNCSLASQVELRTGPIATRVAEVSEEHRADLIVLSWSQDTSSERARVVREVLGASVLPVLLLPAKPLDINETVVGSSSPEGTRQGPSRAKPRSTG